MPSHSLYRPTQLSCGHLYGFGYGGDPEAGARLARLMQHADFLLDIRYRPASRTLHVWNRTALEKVYGTRYAWVQALGNQNYQHRERGIALGTGSLHALTACVQVVASGLSLVLLCGCREEAHCHRLLVKEQIEGWLANPNSFIPVRFGCGDDAGMYAWGRALAHAAHTLGLDSDVVLEAVERRIAVLRSQGREDVERTAKAVP